MLKPKYIENESDIIFREANRIGIGNQRYLSFRVIGDT
jgi:hypothetical protein